MRKRPNIRKVEQQSLSLWLRLAKVSQKIEHAVVKELRRQHYHSMSRFDVLSQLERVKDQWVPIGILASQLLASAGNISRSLDRMTDEDLIKRRPSPTDRRTQLIGITAKGRSVFTAMAEENARIVHQLMGHALSPAERERLKELLDKLRANLAFEEDIRTAAAD